MKKNFQIFWNKFKQFIENPFYWYCAGALLSMILAACYIWEKEILLAILWTLCSIGDIYLAWVHKRLK